MIRMVLASVIRVVTMDLIRMLKHDQLIQVQNSTTATFSSEELARPMLDALKRRSISDIVRVVDLQVFERTGDRQRLSIMQRSYQELLEIDQAKLLVRQRADYEAVQLKFRDSLIKPRAQVAEKEVRAALNTVRAEGETSLEKSRYSRDAEEIMLDVARQKTELEMMVNEQKMAHERYLRELELKEAAFVELSKALTLSQAGTVGRAPDPSVVQALAQALLNNSAPALENRVRAPAGEEIRSEDLRVSKMTGEKCNGHQPAKEKLAGKGD